MRTFKLTLAYDGGAYAGWQYQPNQATIQGTFEATLAKITGEKIAAVASGRTDAGVHALAQVVSFASQTHLAADVLQRALNAGLPDDMAVLSVEETPADFHARHSARRKRYRYLIHDGPIRDVFALRYAWQLYSPLDVAAMHRAAQPLLGEHDFASFQTAVAERATTIRTIFQLSVCRPQTPAISPIITQHSSFITLEIEANGFLYNMVRNIVGTLVEVGRGAQNEDWPRQVLAARDRRAAGPTAPPHGLYLMRVLYD